MSTHLIAYASVCVIPPAYASAQIEDLVAKARYRNSALRVTGALIYSEKHFAQALEGDISSLNALMDSIRRDPRHKQIVVLKDAPVALRRFEGWALGYSGPSVFVDQIIKRAIFEANIASDKALAELMTLMEEFASAKVHS